MMKTQEIGRYSINTCTIRGANRAKGSAGEGIAGLFLTNLGFKIVQYNFRCRQGEIDIVAVKHVKVNGKKEAVYHFVEVKFRTSDTYGLGSEAVNRQKQNRIRSTAQYYLVENGLYNEVYFCFDVVEITGALDNPQIEFLENCF